MGKISVRFVDAECSRDTFVSVVVAVVAPFASTIVVRSAWIVDEYVVDPYDALGKGNLVRLVEFGNAEVP